MSRAYILDATALIGMIEGHTQLMRLYRRAELDEIHLALPATAVHDAAAVVGIGWESWSALLMARGVVCLPLTEQVAVAIADGSGDLVVRHCVFEARATGGVIVTCKPGLYEGRNVTLLAV